MENVSDALIIGFSVLIFVIALTICITMFSMARTTSDFVLHKSDKTNYYTYDNFIFNNEIEVSESKERVVGIEDIVPTLYRYYKEDYRVEFYNVDPIYRSKKTGENINYFDVKAEISRNEPWTGSQDSFKKNIDSIVSGGEYIFPNGSDKYIYESLIYKFDGMKFKEELVYDDTTESATEEDDTKDKKMIIKYTKIS